MSPATKYIIEMIDMLPEQEQQLAFELIKRMVLAWDWDFTKLSQIERERLTKANNEIMNGETVDHDLIDWS